MRLADGGYFTCVEQIDHPWFCLSEDERGGSVVNVTKSIHSSACGIEDPGFEISK